jgi:hypothetical protein
MREQSVTDNIIKVFIDMEYFFRYYFMGESKEEIEIRRLQDTIRAAILVGNKPNYSRSKIDKSFNDSMKRITDLYQASFTQQQTREEV